MIRGCPRRPCRDTPAASLLVERIVQVRIGRHRPQSMWRRKRTSKTGKDGGHGNHHWIARITHAMVPRLWMQLVWGTVTVVVGLIEVAIIWTIVTRYLPVCDMGILIRNMLRHEPPTVIA